MPPLLIQLVAGEQGKPPSLTQFPYPIPNLDQLPSVSRSLLPLLGTQLQVLSTKRPLSDPGSTAAWVCSGQQVWSVG